MIERNTTYTIGRNLRIPLELAECEKFLKPICSREAQISREIARLPKHKALRWPHRMFYIGSMAHQECHANCMKMAGTDENARHVTGWWMISEGVYILHSVMLFEGRYICITPTLEEESTIEFIDFLPDMKLRWYSEPTQWICKRDGRRAPSVVRSDPKKTIREYTRYKDILQLESLQLNA